MHENLQCHCVLLCRILIACLFLQNCWWAYGRGASLVKCQVPLPSHISCVWHHCVFPHPSTLRHVLSAAWVAQIRWNINTGHKILNSSFTCSLDGLERALKTPKRNRCDSKVTVNHDWKKLLPASFNILGDPLPSPKYVLETSNTALDTVNYKCYDNQWNLGQNLRNTHFWHSDQFFIG